ncbi:transcription factor BIM2-like isoform X1 [Phalaenopsis equestris]|uniref:transcription factor BIM2-like isoform X1 n=1 Tax=Phalaenopsis equestris TaxID=78828 RepID=UPI0009E1B3C0|nr:transcription factor BIM2-like isoform X1 [Phalaenopsis equestris]XP_020590670.1 transcription factor BIM2-like isoform X1 [Phalaenopsis equestris]
MESVSRFSKVFEDEDDDDEEYGKREGSPNKGLTLKIDGRSINQKVSTPRSKHSATEQRRRSKINDRFQILRELLPNSDQKRDKASFLLEVIEYIRFLHEKVQKFQSLYPGWSDENTKFMTWNNHQDSGDNLGAAPIIKNGFAPGFVLSDNGIPGSLNPIESELITSVSYKNLETHSDFTNKVVASLSSLQPSLYPVGREPGLVHTDQTLITEADNLASQSQWMRPSSPGDCAISNDILNEHEELRVDEGTISVSCAYSQGLLNNISEALQNSGIDLSQASISVQINLGRKAGARIPKPSVSMEAKGS